MAIVVKKVSDLTGKELKDKHHIRVYMYGEVLEGDKVVKRVGFPEGFKDFYQAVEGEKDAGTLIAMDVSTEEMSKILKFFEDGGIQRRRKPAEVAAAAAATAVEAASPAPAPAKPRKPKMSAEEKATAEAKAAQEAKAEAERRAAEIARGAAPIPPLEV